MLPPEQKAHEICCGDRLDLLAQSSQREAMNTSKKPPLAPFDGRFRFSKCVFCPRVARSATGELTAQHDAAPFQGGESHLDVTRSEPDSFREGWCRGGTHCF
jgi:hypothetical protein